MKIDFSTTDWPLYVVMVVISFGIHLTILVTLAFLPTGGGARVLEAELVDALPGSRRGLSLSVETLLQTWKSHLADRYDRMKRELAKKADTIQEDKAPGMEENWTAENTPAKLRYYARLVGTDLEARLKESATRSGRFDIVIRLKTDASTLFDDLALVSHLSGIATRFSRYKTSKLKVEVLEPDQTRAGSFEISTESARRLATGKKPLREIFEEGVASALPE